MHYEIRAAIFDMTNKEKEIFCSVLKNAKLPYGCASNVSRYVHTSERKVVGYKSHDAHFILHYLLQFAMKKTLKPEVALPLIRLSAFLRASPKKPPLKRKFVTTHQLQQQQKKMNKKSPEVRKMMSGEQDVPVKEKPNARRKLELEDDTSDGENTGENDVAVKSPPPPPLTEYEKQKIHNLEENEKVYRKLGLPSLVSTFKHDVAQNSKGKGKNGKSKKGKDREPDEECDSQYIPENEGDDQSDDSLEKIKIVERKKLLGPRTRSRANAAPGIEKAVRRAGTVAEKEVTSSYRPALVKPTCSKMFKQSSKDEGDVGAGTVAAGAGTGTVADYLALRDR
ncbi:hypothetical protein POM88_010795 [Heracleum sosnowskyi]|uniref:Uncharacterized protein n=1 Tax=Heracleum sosnowskyi TaxID=360622 RepID=A0AAD8IV22_9APIA|nr:hypothetical protein POM88_010795 [Heracleum sosnowskyi]